MVDSDQAKLGEFSKKKLFWKNTRTTQNQVLCTNFVIFRWPEIRKVVRYLPKKNSASSPAVASARIAPKICRGQLQTIYSDFPKFHLNPLTSGGVIPNAQTSFKRAVKYFQYSAKILRSVIKVYFIFRL